jgi:hypothetical protein
MKNKRRYEQKEQRDETWLGSKMKSAKKYVKHRRDFLWSKRYRSRKKRNQPNR